MPTASEAKGETLMARLCPRLSRQAAFVGLGFFLAVGSARSSWAQGFTPDPFNGVGDYNIGYRDYLTPTYPNGFTVTPNQGVLSGGARANQFQKYLDEFRRRGSLTDRDRRFQEPAGVRVGGSLLPRESPFRVAAPPNRPAQPL